MKIKIDGTMTVEKYGGEVLDESTSGGTGNCVAYAQKLNKPLIIIDPREFGGG